MKQSMCNTLGVLRGTFMSDHEGRKPSAFRIHPNDWYKLLSEVRPPSGSMGPDTRFMGMVPLIDNRWPEGFPICVDQRGAAEAIEAGAHHP